MYLYTICIYVIIVYTIDHQFATQLQSKVLSIFLII